MNCCEAPNCYLSWFLKFSDTTECSDRSVKDKIMYSTGCLHLPTWSCWRWWGWERWGKASSAQQSDQSQGCVCKPVVQSVNLTCEDLKTFPRDPILPSFSLAASFSLMSKYSVCSSTFTFTTSLLWVRNMHRVKMAALLVWLSLRTKVTLWKHGNVFTKRLRCKFNILETFQFGCRPKKHNFTEYFHLSGSSPVCKPPLLPSPFESCFLILTFSDCTSTTLPPDIKREGHTDFEASLPRPQSLHSCWHSFASSFWSCFAYWGGNQIILY